MRLLIVYGSQTGQSEAIAGEIFESAFHQDLDAELFCAKELLDNYQKQLTTAGTLSVLVFSSTGDGDPPDNASKLWRKLRAASLADDHLSACRYTLLGLGDSNYSSFMRFPKKLNRRLLDLGAKPFYEPAWADDATGLEDVVEPWIAQLWPAINKECSSKGEGEGEEGEEEEQEKEKEDNTHRVLTADVSALSSAFNRLGITNSSTLAALFTNRLASETGNVSNDVSLQLPVVRDSLFAVEETSTENNTDLKLDSYLLNRLALTFDEPPSLFELQVRDIENMCPHYDERQTLQLAVDQPLMGSLNAQPGDSLSFFCSNETGEVEALIYRLGYEKTSCFVVSSQLFCEDPQSKRARVGRRRMAHLPLNQPVSLEFLFTHCFDIRQPIKKALLTHMSARCIDDTDSKLLRLLASREYAQLYDNCIRKEGLSLLDLLLAFPSCRPELASLFEHLPPLQPRLYSLANHLTDDRTPMKFVFNVLQFEAAAELGRFYGRSGVCTGAFSRLDSDGTSVLLFKNPLLNCKFRLGSQNDGPVLLIGPGTGVAPFVGFLQSRLLSDISHCFNELLLLTGFRYYSKTFLFKDFFLSNKAAFVKRNARVCCAFSRDFDKFSDEIHLLNESNCTAKYVQDLMKFFQQKIISWFDDPTFKVFVCGDAKGMAVDVFKTFQSLLVDANRSVEILERMKNEGRYLEDVWTP